ncbi:hypothetical protein [Maribellus maritimus]|uniref:hypothetical protein n=1 Tax=Maribellus maritimus TaxID=2870838 RepID=UPI001EEC4B60|nr:hypothetical protein [Maribellus maritimus]MCG6190472.1 hypothetical protein [Maribellus maritimus]
MIRDNRESKISLHKRYLLYFWGKNTNYFKNNCNTFKNQNHEITIFLFIVVSFISFCTYSQNNPPHLKIGAGPSLGEWASTDDGWEEDWGAGANFRAVVYSDKSRFSLSPSHIYFPVSKFNYTYSYSSTAIEVDPAMHYINVEGRFSFVKLPKVESYLFIGPSFLIYKESVSASNTYTDVFGKENQFKTGAIARLV